MLEEIVFRRAKKYPRMQEQTAINGKEKHKILKEAAARASPKTVSAKNGAQKKTEITVTVDIKRERMMPFLSAI